MTQQFETLDLHQLMQTDDALKAVYFTGPGSSMINTMTEAAAKYGEERNLEFMYAYPGNEYSGPCLVFKKLEKYQAKGTPVDHLSDDEIWHIACIVHNLFSESPFAISIAECAIHVRAGFVDPDTSREMIATFEAICAGA